MRTHSAYHTNGKIAEENVAANLPQRFGNHEKGQVLKD
jgi:hypothetical protein